MGLNLEKPYMVFCKEINDYKFYRIGLSKKDKEGKYINGYVDVRFKGGADIPNKTQIYIKDWFLSFNLDKDGKTILYLQIMDYELVSDVIDKEHKDIKKNDTKEDLFVEFAKEHEDDDLVLPF